MPFRAPEPPFPATRPLYLWGAILGLAAALGASVPAAAEVAPLNGDLTFARTGKGVFKIGTEALVTSNVRRDPIQGGAGARDPAWSPDAQRIAFADGRPASLDIYVVRTDDRSKPKQLTRDPADDTQPDWSPGGEQIVFTSRRDGNSEIYVMTSTGAQQARLTFSPGADRQPAWSPDGTRIAFVSKRGGSLAIWTMNANGTNAVALTPSVGYATDPTWSPNGKRIAYATGSGRDATSIVSVDSRRGADRRAITTGAKGDRLPAWSPDGLQIAFSRGERVMVDSYRGPRAGQGLEPVTLTGQRPRRSVTPGNNPDWGVLPPLSKAPPPEVGETVNASPGGAGVTVRVPGALGPAPLTGPRQLPVDTMVDTTDGRLTLVAPGGGRTTAVASMGRFTYRQADKEGEDGMSVVDLARPSGCGSRDAAARSDGVGASKRPNSVVLSVEGLVAQDLGVGPVRAFAARGPSGTGSKGKKGSGRARRKRRSKRSFHRGLPDLRGNYLRGDPSGTEWTTIEECERTVFEVQDGVVEVEDTETGNELEVAAGQCYAAPSRFAVARERCR